MIECRITNTRYAVRDGNGSQSRAIIERIRSNTRYAIRDSNGGEGGATIESLISNTRYAIRYSDRSERGANMKSTISNARYWSIEGNNTYSIFISIADNICAKASSVMWCYDITIGRGVGDLPCWVDASFFYDLTNFGSPIGCLICCESSTRDVAGRRGCDCTCS